MEILSLLLMAKCKEFVGHPRVEIRGTRDDKLLCWKLEKNIFNRPVKRLPAALGCNTPKMLPDFTKSITEEQYTVNGHKLAFFHHREHRGTQRDLLCDLGVLCGEKKVFSNRFKYTVS